jgi:hypothetical protein
MMLDAPDGIETERLVEVADLEVFDVNVAVRASIVGILENNSATNFHSEILHEAGVSVVGNDVLQPEIEIR